MSYACRLAASLAAVFSILIVAGCGGTAGGDSSGPISAYPSPGSSFASPGTQISLVGLDPENPGDIKVTGSSSGEHSGKFESYSAVTGASFVPDEPFEPEETVTVETDLDIHGATDGKFTFRTASFRTDAAPPPRKLPKETKREIRHEDFRSRPDLKPPYFELETKSKEKAAPGKYFLSPKKDGPVIIDGEGELVWFKPDTESADFRTQSYRGEPVLTWWEGPFNAGGYTEGNFVIADQKYEELKRVFAGNGYKGDLHEFVITPRNTAYIPIYRTVAMDLTEYGGPKNGAVLDSIAQEIDIETGLVLWEWHSLDHIGLRETHIQFPTSPKEAFDYFHINSINDDDDGNVIMSGRNTFSVVKADKQTGEVMWRLGGKKSDFEMGEGTNFSWQHDAIRTTDGNLTLYDNAANYFGDPTYDHSRGLVLKVGEPGTKVELAEPPLVHPDRLLAPSQGNMQTLPDGNRVVGWGSQPWFTEYTPAGEVVANGTYTSRNSSYRTYKLPWEGIPSDLPAIATAKSGEGLKVWVSWNGDTSTAEWRLLSGPDENSLEEVDTVPRDGFETAFETGSAAQFVAVEALDADGNSLGRSAVIPAGESDTGVRDSQG